ncbi:MAG: bifunctional UDP-N-acetylglucosamine diphosphorylase/glucosamine-1-phosphate N-acetyltransferase GlmU [Actinomycetota bacterium]|nr:bifunctional UDP-N-acetylglucosamine diphosphorylase/glucosamine-1-phosphate N-acetyltransferase GlmU [Actinomycetota bacterium]
MAPGVSAIVLAAGEGKRLLSSKPKVIHNAAGKPLLAHVLTALEPLELDRIVVVASPRVDEIRAAVSPSDKVTFVVQDPARGTADAVGVGLDSVDHSRSVLVVPGDTPLLRTETLQEMLTQHDSTGSVATVLTARVADPTGYGRVTRSEDGALTGIVEDRDATEEQRAIDEINAGVYVFDHDALASALGDVEKDNAQSEYYLTDVIKLLADGGRPLATTSTDEAETAGVNSRTQLAAAAALLRQRICARWLEAGVSIVDPSVTYIDATVTIEKDATIQPFTFLEGETRIGEAAEIGPQARVVDSEIAAGASVSFAVIRGSRIGPDASVGPFASLRPGTTLEKGARVGTFVETKHSVIGEESKANHLAYLGDATIGKGVNVGAGTITCNWDGQSKHKTIVDDDAYIGSDTMLVAPVHIGARAATGAGSVVKGEIPPDALAVGVPARVLKGKGNKMDRETRPGGARSDPEQESGTEGASGARRGPDPEQERDDGAAEEPRQ